MRLGIDLGTTRTVVAVCDRGNYPVVAFEGPDGEQTAWYPTVVATNGAVRVYGPDAESKLDQPGWHIMRSFKRLLGRSATVETVLLDPDSEPIPLATLLTEFLLSLRQDLLARSNCPVPSSDGRPLEAMIAVPAGASSAQRFVTLEAFRAAGFDVKGVMNEPSAAGVEYAHRYRSTLSNKRERVLVYDLGGGTFDASLVDLGSGGHRVLANAGLQDLGGDDFDAVLLSLACLKAGRDPSALATSDRVRLLQHCRGQKEGLNPSSKKIVVDLDDELSVTVTTAAYYEACAPLVERTLGTVERVLPKGLDERFDAEDVAGVYVVGGASDLPVVARVLREVFGRRVRRSVYSSAATAVGLAIGLDDAESHPVAERFSRTFGVFRELRGGSEVEFDPILGADLEVAADGAERIRRYRAAHNVGHFRFVECDRLEGTVPVGDLVPLGELRFAFDADLRDAELRDVEIRRSERPGPLVEERYTVDGTGMVHVRVTDLDTGYTVERRLGAPIV